MQNSAICYPKGGREGGVCRRLVPRPPNLLYINPGTTCLRLQLSALSSLFSVPQRQTRHIAILSNLLISLHGQCRMWLFEMTTAARAVNVLAVSIQSRLTPSLILSKLCSTTSDYYPTTSTFVRLSRVNLGFTTRA